MRRNKEADLIVDRLKNGLQKREFVPYWPVGLAGVDPLLNGKSRLISPNGKYSIVLPSWLAWRLQGYQHGIALIAHTIGRNR